MISSRIVIEVESAVPPAEASAADVTVAAVGASVQEAVSVAEKGSAYDVVKLAGGEAVV